jgi:hypothetical protein
MAASKRPGSSKYPGSGQPRVLQPDQRSAPVPEQMLSARGLQTSPVRHVAIPVPTRVPGYVDPALFTTGIFQEQADYEATVQHVVAQITSGKIQARKPTTKTAPSNWYPSIPKNRSPDPTRAGLFRPHEGIHLPRFSLLVLDLQSLDNSSTSPPEVLKNKFFRRYKFSHLIC